MAVVRKSGIVLSFLFGLLGGFLAYKGLLSLSGHTILPESEQVEWESRLQDLERKNNELGRELIRLKVLAGDNSSDADLPYSDSENARQEVESARRAAQTSGRFLMVTFGANWCMDCRNLHRQLKSDEVSSYADPLFDFVNVNVGKFNQNRDVAQALGVSLSRGIPVAVFFDPDGIVIGTTNDGQLEPARRYSSKQILKFIRDIAERSRISAPDSVE